MLNLNLKKYKIVDFSNCKEGILELSIKSNSNSCKCPKCGKLRKTRGDQKLHYRKKTLKHIMISNGLSVDIRPIKRYFRCDKCKYRFMETFDFEAEKGFHTKDFEKYIIESFGFMSLNQIAEINRVSPKRMYEIIERIDIEKINKYGIQILEELDEIYLGVDEHSFSGHDMVLIITELKSKKLVAVLDGITKKKLEDWINSLSLKTQMKVKMFSTDMNKGYANSLLELPSKPVFAVDKMHLFMEANKAVYEVLNLVTFLLREGLVKIDDIIKIGKFLPKTLNKEDIEKLLLEIRKSNVPKYRDKTKERLNTDEINKKKVKNINGIIVDYKEISLAHFIDTKYKKMFQTRENNLSELARLRLNQIFSEFDYNGYLAEVWNIKEDFMNAIDNLDLEEVDRIKSDCLNSEIGRLQQFGRTLTNWYKGIKGYIETAKEQGFKCTNALTEVMNKICKDGKRQANGFRIKDNYLRKIFTKTMLKNFKDQYFLDKNLA